MTIEPKILSTLLALCGLTILATEFIEPFKKWGITKFKSAERFTGVILGFYSFFFILALLYFIWTC